MMLCEMRSLFFGGVAGEEGAEEHVLTEKVGAALTCSLNHGGGPACESGHADYVAPVAEVELGAARLAGL